MKNCKVVVTLLTLYLSLHVAATAQISSPDTLMKYLRNLCSSRYEGRLAGTQGYDNAAKYVTDQLRIYGVRPYEEDWIQHYYEVECNQIENASLEVYFPWSNERMEYILGNDFCCAGMTGRGYIDAPVVFCGYGIDNAAFNEYAKVDARGKVVMVLTGVPDFLSKSITEDYVTLRDKARVAREHGAVGMVAVNMSPYCRPTEVQGQVFCGEGEHTTTFPILLATRWCGDQLLTDEPCTIDSAIACMDSLQQPKSFHLFKKFAINVNANYNPNASTGNVVGIMDGCDPRLKRELIVVGAHLDHVGMQGMTCLFPGADNNASGVAVLLETARLMAASDIRIGRSVVFAFFSGGEQRHIGSEQFLKTFKKQSWIDAFIDVECVGNGDSLIAMGGKRFPMLWKIMANNDSIYTQYLTHQYESNPTADAKAFTKIGIPSLTLTTIGGNRYPHVPSDIPENVDRALITKAANLLFNTIIELANGDYQGRSEESRYFMKP